jgi:hypothetical protein
MSRLAVSHNAVNLAGPAAGRPNYLKTVISNKTIISSSESYAELIKRSYTQGPNSRLANFYRWARNPDLTGYIGRTYPIYNIGTPDDLDNPDMKNHLPLPDSEMEYLFNNMGLMTGSYITAYHLRRSAIMSCNLSVGPCMYTQWARRKWYEDHFEHVSNMSKPWKSSYDSSSGQVTLHMPGRYTDTFTPSDFDLSATYLYGALAFGLNNKMFIYRVGSGNSTLDAIAANVESWNYGFYPAIPIRVNNMMIAESCPEGYEQTTKSLTKAFGIDITEIEDKLNENPEIGDIDDVFLIFGVQANSADRSCLKYVYEFFKMIARDHWPTPSEGAAYTASMETYYSEFADYLAWYEAGSVGTAPTVTAPPTTGRGQFGYATSSSMPGGWSANFTGGLRWSSIREQFGTGLKNITSKVGDVWWETSGSVCTLYWQYTQNWYKYVRIDTATFYNWASGSGVDLHSIVGSNDETTFVLPLNTKVMTSIGVIAAAEVSTQCAILQSAAWKVITPGILGALIFFVAFLAMIVFPPLNIGILGSGAAVGTSLGFAGLGAAIIGAIVNTVVAMIVMRVIAKVSVLIFGEKIGAIIGAIVSFVAVTVGAGLIGGQSLSAAFGNMLQVDKLLALTNAVGGGVAGYVRAAANEVYADIQEVREKYETDMDMVQDLYAQNVGYASGVIDTLGLTDVNFGVLSETPQAFLDRTLLCGSDIAQLSMDLLTNFANITTDVSLPGT